MEYIKNLGSYIYSNTAWAYNAAWSLGAEAYHDLGSMYTEARNQTVDVLYDVATTNWQETSNKAKVDVDVDVDQVKIETGDSKGEIFFLEKYPSETSSSSVSIIPTSNENEKSAVTTLIKQAETEKLDRNFD
jgi:hypothetical protein